MAVEDGEDSDEEDPNDDNVGSLEMSLYGTRDAAQNCSSTVGKHLKSIGFKQGLASFERIFLKVSLSLLIFPSSFPSFL